MAVTIPAGGCGGDLLFRVHARFLLRGNATADDPCSDDKGSSGLTLVGEGVAEVGGVAVTTVVGDEGTTAPDVFGGIGIKIIHYVGCGNDFLVP